MASKITLELNPAQIGALVEKLPVAEKIKLVRKLENETWPERLDDVVLTIRKQVKKSGVSDNDISRLCEESRRRICYVA
jgi:Mg/Co/Ni transporter MgtE